MELGRRRRPVEIDAQASTCAFALACFLFALILSSCSSARTVELPQTATGSANNGTAAAQQTDGHWLIGTWDGPSGRIIDIWSVRPDGTARGTMGIAGQGQGQAEIRVEGSRVHVVNAIKNVFDLTLVSDGRLTGTVRLAADGTVHAWAATKRNGKPCTEPIPAGGQSYGPPKYCALDTWIFSNGRIQTVVKVSSDTVVMTGPGISGPCPGCVFFFDGNLALRSIERTDGKPLGMSYTFRPVGAGWHFWDFPLAPKKSWRFSGKVISGSHVLLYTVHCSIVAYEDVTTQAGTFKAFKVWRRWLFRASEPDNDHLWYDVVWFAPEVKTIVKRNTHNTANPADRDWELVSYSLK